MAAVLSRPLIAAPAPALIKGKAEHVISIWLGGGMAQIDTFDPKRRGDPRRRRPAPTTTSIDTAVPGVRLCEHLRKVAPLMDRVTAVRTVNHDVIDEHAAATNRMHTGRADQRHDRLSLDRLDHRPRARRRRRRCAALRADRLPERHPRPRLPRRAVRLPLPHRHQPRPGRPFPSARMSAPTASSAAASFSPPCKPRRRRPAIRQLTSYDAAIEQSLKLSGPAFNRVFQLDEEPADLRQRYGGEFGQRCLLSRRLVEHGVRFIEVSHNLNFLNGTGWDTHNEGILKQHELIQELDTAVAALITDLEARRLLDKTLIVVTTEFGRPPEFDGGGGRGHQGSAFTCVLAGGGLQHCGAWGETDELSKKIVANPVSVPDFFATICAAVGVDYRANLYDGDRPVPITDQGTPIKELFS